MTPWDRDDIPQLTLQDSVYAYVRADRMQNRPAL